MTGSLNRIIFWTPRILCILLAIFISLFSLDVFGEGYGFWKTIEALLIHLIPTAIILIVLIISWRHSWVGAIIFVILAAYSIFITRGHQHWSAYMAISGSLFVISLLFMADWLSGKQNHQST